MKLGIAVCLAAAMFASQSARADVIDLSTITCKQFFENTSNDKMSIILAWLHGYYREEDDPPIINTDTFKEDLQKFGAYCATHPTVGIITAADDVLQK